MSGEILRYVLVSPEDVEGDHEYTDYNEALAEAQKIGHAVVQRTYEYDDSELVWTPTGSEIWPDPTPGIVSKLSREKCIELLEAIGVACYDDESTSLLREAVLENVNDGNIERANLEE